MYLYRDACTHSPSIASRSSCALMRTRTRLNTSASVCAVLSTPFCVVASELWRILVAALVPCCPFTLRSMPPPSSASTRQGPVLRTKAPAPAPHQARTPISFRMFIPGTNVLPPLRRAVAPSVPYSCDTPEPRLTHAFPLRLGAIVPACHDATRRHGGRNTMHPGDARISQQSPYAVHPLASTTVPIPLAHVMRRDSDAQDVVPYPLAQFGRHPR